MAPRTSVAAHIEDEKASMRRWSIILTALLSIMAAPAFAAPLDSALRQQLLALFDS
jgi:hypothetical protein